MIAEHKQWRRRRKNERERERERWRKILCENDARWNSFFFFFFFSSIATMMKTRRHVTIVASENEHFSSPTSHPSPFERKREESMKQMTPNEGEKNANRERRKKYWRSEDMFFDKSKLRMAWCVGILAHLCFVRYYQHEAEHRAGIRRRRQRRRKENSPIHRCLQSLAKLVIIIIDIINSQVLLRKEEGDDDEDEDDDDDGDEE